MSTTPTSGPISIGNIQTALGVTSLGAARTRTPLATTAASGTVSLGSLRGLGGNMTSWFDATTTSSYADGIWSNKAAVVMSGSSDGAVSRGTASILRGSASNGIPTLFGASTAGVKFNRLMTPDGATYTVFHVARYAGAVATGRIFDANTTVAGESVGGWYSGFGDAGSGVAWHGGNAITALANIHDRDWVMSADQLNLYKSNKVDRTIGTGNITPNLRLSINDGMTTSTKTAWQVAEMMTFDRIMNAAEIGAVEDYLTDKYYLDLPRDPSLVVHAKDVSLIGGSGNVGTWTGPSGTVSFAPLGTPQVYNTGGLNNSAFVRFDRSASQSFTSTAPFTVNLATAGFTAVAAVRLTGTIGEREQIFSFCTAPDANLISMYRNVSTSGMAALIRDNASSTDLFVSMPAVITQGQWAVFTMRYDSATRTLTGYANNVQKGNQPVAGTTLTSRTFPAGNCALGLSSSPVYGRLNADMKCLLVYDRALSTTEMKQAYEYCLGTQTTVPTGPTIFLDAATQVLESTRGRVPLWPPLVGTALSNTEVTFQGYGSGGAPPTIGYAGSASSASPSTRGSHVSFDRSKSQYMALNAPLTLNMSTNGGFTIVVQARMTGTPGNYERLFDLASPGYGNLAVFLARVTIGGQLTFRVATDDIGTVPTTARATTPGGSVVQGEWATWTCRYTKASGTMQLFKNNNVLVTSAGVPDLADRTLTNVWLGRSSYVADNNAYLNGDIRFFGVYDRSLSDADVTKIHTFLGKDDFSPSRVVRSHANLRLWLDAEHSARFSASSNVWTDLSGYGNDFSISPTAISTAGNVYYMNFSGSAGVAKRVVNGTLTDVLIGAAANSTIVVFSSILASNTTWRTLARSSRGTPNVVHQVLVNSGGTLLGEYWGSTLQFVSSGYSITTQADVYSRMNMYAIRLAPNPLNPVWEVFVANSRGMIASAGNITTAQPLNTLANVGIALIGGHTGTGTADPLSGTQYWGNVASFMAFDRHLTTSELQAIYNDQYARYGLIPPLVTYAFFSTFTVAGSNTTYHPITPYASGAGASIYFNSAVSSYMTVTGMTSYDWAERNVTMEAWIYPLSATNHYIFGNHNQTDSGSVWAFNVLSTGQFQFTYWAGLISSSFRFATPTNSVPLNTWSHLAMVYTRASKTMRMYINGVAQPLTAIQIDIRTTPATTTTLQSGVYTANVVDQPSYSTELRVGVYNNIYSNAYLGDVRIVESNAVYTTDFTPPIAPLADHPGATTKWRMVTTKTVPTV